MNEPLVRRSPRFARHRWIGRKLRTYLPHGGLEKGQKFEGYRDARRKALMAFYARGKDA